MTRDEFERYAEESVAALDAQRHRLVELTLLDYAVDFDAGFITFTKPRSSSGDDADTDTDTDTTKPWIEAEVLPLASRGHRSGSWLWAWANPGIPAAQAAPTATLRELAKLTGQTLFEAEAPFPVDDRTAERLAAIACRHLGLPGLFRVPAHGSDWLLGVRSLQRYQPEADIAALAEAAIRASLTEDDKGTALLNTLRRRFPELRIALIGADLRGPRQPWAHDLHVQMLIELGHDEADAIADLGLDDQYTPRFATHRPRDLRGANLANARLDGAVLRGVDLRGARLDGASLIEADLSGADLRDASLQGTFLEGTNLARARLAGADLTGAELARTLLAGVDLSTVRGLDALHHLGPSEISMSTLVASGFEIDPAFLRSAGVSRGLIEDLMRGKRLGGNTYQTCFLSYSSKDGAFASRLYAALTDAGVRVFWDHYDVIPGESLERQIAEAIRELRRLVVVLSPHSMASDWVEREVRLAWSRRRDALLPIRLTPIEPVQRWAAGLQGLPDLSQAFPIQDFSQWQDDAAFDHALRMLLTALGGGVDLRPSGAAAKDAGGA